MNGCSAISTGARGASAGGGRICTLERFPRQEPATRKLLKLQSRPTLYGPVLIWPGSLNLLDNLLPLNGIKRRTRLDGNYLLGGGEGELDPAGRARKRKIERIRIAVAAVILAGSSDALEQNEA